MKHTKFFGATSAALMIVIILTLVLAPAAAASKYKTLYKFTGGTNGRFPSSNLVFDQAGNFYGTTSGGGTSTLCWGGCGTVFKLTPNGNGGWNESVLYSFCSLTNCSDGDSPSGLSFDQAGNLYGTTFTGGSSDTGTVFELTPNADGSWSESVLHSFCSLSKCGDGGLPVGGVILDEAGNVHGTTLYGHNGSATCSTIFQLAPPTTANTDWKYTLLFEACEQFDGFDRGPGGALIFDGAGNLYGTWGTGGAGNCPNRISGCGVVFKLTPNSGGQWTESVLYNFCSQETATMSACRDGWGPDSALLFDQAGNLYGTTAYGGVRGHCAPRVYGPSGCGVAFRLTPNADGSWTESVLHTFTGHKDGATPAGGFTFDQAGNLYGTTFAGGNLTYCATSTVGCGVVFELGPTSTGGWHETELHTFIDKPDANPAAGVIFDAAGNIYGTTSGGYGSVFEITP